MHLDADTSLIDAGGSHAIKSLIFEAGQIGVEDFVHAGCTRVTIPAMRSRAQVTWVTKAASARAGVSAARLNVARRPVW